MAASGRNERVEGYDFAAICNSIASCDLLAIERKRICADLSKVKFQEQANQFYSSSLLKIAQFPEVEIRHFDDWEIDPLRSRSWRLYFNWLSFIQIFIADHHWTRNERGLNVCKKAICGWIENYGDSDENYPHLFVWNDYGTAARAFQFALFLHYIKNFAADWAEQNVSFLQRIGDMLAKHGELLAKDTFYAKYNNHGLEQCKVLLLLGRYFSNEGWKETAEQRLLDEFNFSFTEEGVHVENSPAYHAAVINKFLSIVTDSSANDVHELVKKFRQRSESMLSYLCRVIRPDLRLPIIGDTENLLVGDVTDLPVVDIYKNYFQGLDAHKHFLYILSRGAIGEREEKSHCLYRKSGYAIFKDWTVSQKAHENSFHLIAKAGALSSYHYQEDEGNVIFCAFGEDWLIDSGIYKYEPDNPIRIYARSRYAHNVPLIENCNYPSKHEQRLGKFTVLDSSIEESLPFVKFSVDVFKEVAHIRKIQWISKELKLEIEDSFDMKDGISRNLILQWHFPTDKSISILNTNLVNVSSVNRTLQISVDEAADAIEIIKGIEGERISIVSYRQGTYEDSQTIYFKFNKRDNVSFKTTMQFV